MYYVNQNVNYGTDNKMYLIEWSIKLRRICNSFYGKGFMHSWISSVSKRHMSIKTQTIPNTSVMSKCNTGKPNETFPLKITFGVLKKYLSWITKELLLCKMLVS